MEKIAMCTRLLYRALVAAICCGVRRLGSSAHCVARGQVPGLDNLDRLEPGRTKAENALWIENALSARFNTSKRVVVADIKGPAQITMIHFAVPGQ